VAMWTSAILLAGCAEAAWAQATALTVSGSPAPLVISTAPPGSQPAARSNNTISLDATARSVEINIAKDKGTTLGITYVFTATVAAGVVPSQTRTVTLTMSSYP
jgi:hypothetical protein